MQLLQWRKSIFLMRTMMLRRLVLRPLLLGVLILVRASVFADPDPPQYRELQRIERSDTYRFQDWSNLIEHFAFNPEGSQIAAAATYELVAIWDVMTGSVIWTVPCLNSTSVSWSPDGRLLAGGCGDGFITHLWYPQDRTLAHVLEDIRGEHISWSPDSRQFVTGSLRVFNAKTFTEVVKLGPHVGVPHGAYWSPDGSMIATPSGWDGIDLNVWLREGERLDTYWAGYSAAWSPDSTRLASTGQVREVSTGLPVVVMPDMEGIITWHPNGAWIASTGHAQINEEGLVFFWDAETGDLVTTWDFGDCDIRGLTWSASGERFALSCVQYEPDYGNELILGELIR
jgi:WD40 repeat protein